MRALTFAMCCLLAAAAGGASADTITLTSIKDNTLYISPTGTLSNGAGHGVWVYGTGAKAWAAGNTISDNVLGVNITNGGIFESAGTNAVRNNGTDVSGTITVPVPALR